MNFIFTDTTRKDTCYLDGSFELDMEIGRKDDKEYENDFEIAIPASDYKKAYHVIGGYLYSVNTEYGGKIYGIKTNSEDKIVTLTGLCFRGMLDRFIVEPTSGAEYLVLSGTLKSCLNKLLAPVLGDIFYLGTVPSITITSHKVHRYTSMLKAVERLLKSQKKKLVIEAVSVSGKMKVKLSVDDIVDRSDSVEVSQDTGLTFNIESSSLEYIYMICAGSGNLKDRLIVYLRKKVDGTIEEVSSFTPGIDEYVYFYDYPSETDRDELIVRGIEKFEEINPLDKFDVDSYDELADIPIGDKITGRDYLTGTKATKKITGKVIRMSDGILEIETKVGD